MMVRVMRGQVVVRELSEHSGRIWTPEGRQRDVKTHRGIVLAVGAPYERRGVPQAFDVQPGDIVQFHYDTHREGWTRPWPLDGKPATWVPQRSVDAVLEPDAVSDPRDAASRMLDAPARGAAHAWGAG